MFFRTVSHNHREDKAAAPGLMRKGGVFHPIGGAEGAGIGDCPGNPVGRHRPGFSGGCLRLGDIHPAPGFPGFSGGLGDENRIQRGLGAWGEDGGGDVVGGG